MIEIFQKLYPHILGKKSLLPQEAPCHQIWLLCETYMLLSVREVASLWYFDLYMPMHQNDSGNQLQLHAQHTPCWLYLEFRSFLVSGNFYLSYLDQLTN
jgi:hypothetical protein